MDTTLAQILDSLYKAMAENAQLKTQVAELQATAEKTQAPVEDIAPKG